MDDKLNHKISSVLAVGMTASIIVLFIGLAMLIFLGGDYEEVTMSLPEIAHGILQGNPIAVIDLGIILLIATPLVRVISLAVTFAMKKETKFVAACIIVLVLVAVTVILKSGA